MLNFMFTNPSLHSITKINSEPFAQESISLKYGKSFMYQGKKIAMKAVYSANYSVSLLMD